MRLNGLVRRGWKPAAGFGALLATRELLGRLREQAISGQAVLVTGGSRGLGLKLAEELLSEGCRVAICARDTDELERARVRLAARGDVIAIRCDVQSRQEVQAMIADVTRHFGRIDILVNNAGIIQVGPLQAMELEQFEQAMDTMFWGTLYPTLAVLPQMRERREGRIVNITSVSGKISVPHMVPYSAAKFAAVGLSEGLRAELAADGISVTTVAPGEMRIGSFRKSLFAGRREEEYRWFALRASLPWTISADRSVRHIIRATKRREAELIFPWTMNLAVRLHGIAPGLTTNALGVANRLLPSGEGVEPGVEEGAVIEPRASGPVWNAATVAGRRAAVELNEPPPMPRGDQVSDSRSPA